MPSKNEVEVLRDQITEEVNRDAVVISGQLFPQSAKAREPDIARVSDADLANLYRQKYMDQDRTWLQAEARRDPVQFEKVARSIGVVLPEEMPNLTPSPATLPQGPMGVSAPQAPVAPAQPIQLPAAPMVQPQMPIVPGALPQAPAGPPVVLGPQPILPPEY